jgi:CBS domain-containing protein
MTEGVVTAEPETPALDVARLMRDHNVGSVVIVDGSGTPCAMVTDRDLAVRVLAEETDLREPVSGRVSAPLISGEPETSLEEAAALMVQHRIRRLPVIEGDRLAGIVTLDDIAVRTGNLDVAQKMTQEVLEGALPQFYFRDREG